MDPTALKRRKTSPSSSVAATLQNTQNTQARTQSRDGEPNSSQRASFMSPTKASLARFNPGLLPPSDSAESRIRSGRDLDIQDRHTRDGKNGRQVQLRDQERSTNGAFARPSLGANGTSLEATPQRRSRTPKEDDASSRELRFAITQYLRASPPDGERDTVDGARATQVEGDTHDTDRYNDTAPPADAPTVQAEFQNPQQPNTPSNPRVPRTSSGMGQSDDGEPSLPSTPIHLGLERPPERPKGLLFSSPSRRQRREGSSRPKSSPLKPQDPAPDLSISRPPRVYTSLGHRIYLPNMPRPPPRNEETEQYKLQETLAGLEKKLLEIEDSLIRQSLVSRWQQEDGKDMKALTKRKREASQNSTKVSRSREELAQIRGHQASHAGDEENATVRASAPLSGSSALDPTSEVPHSLVRRLDRFLTFSRLSSGRHTVQDPDAPHPVDGDIPQDGVAPFKTTITNAALLPSNAGDTLQQRQDLALSTPREVLRAKLQVTASIPAQTIDQLHILGISPWADQELGAWLRALPADSELSVVGTSFGRYFEVCKDRAQCFVDVEREFESLLPRPGSINNSDHSLLITYLGRQDITLVRDQVSLDVAWLVKFSDDGDVESRITANARFPDTWRRTIGAELDKIGSAFDLLAVEKGALEAIRVVCKLMFPA